MPVKDTTEGDISELPRVIRPGESDSFDWGGFGVDWKIDGADTEGRFAIVHHTPFDPDVLAAPLHYHHNEDEYSYVLEGTMGALLGDEVVEAEAGSWVYKPREQWHTFWNPGDTPCHVIEVISPAGFEEYFREVTDAEDDVEQWSEINEKYSLEMDFDSVPDLCERFGLTYPEG
jgi:mannose-6-phosphate isomerase-like protein (cupin superfamily)